MAKNIQLIINEEDFLTQRHVEQVLKKWVDPNTRDFNFEHFSLSLHSFPKILQSFNEFPMMADWRTVVVDDLELLFKKVPAAAISNTEEVNSSQTIPENSSEEPANEKVLKLNEALKNLSPQTRLLLITRKLDKRTALYKTLVKTAEIHEFKKLYSNQLPGFVSEEARLMGLTLESGVAQLLSELVGGDLSSLVMELKKLKLYVQPEVKIKREHVVSLVGSGLLDAIWILSDKVAQRDLGGALDVSRRLFEQGENAIGMVAVLVTHFRRLMLLQAQLAQSPGGQVYSKSFGMTEYAFNQSKGQLKHFVRGKLKRVYLDLMQLNFNLRQSRIGNHTQFYNFIQGACTGS